MEIPVGRLIGAMDTAEGEKQVETVRGILRFWHGKRGSMMKRVFLLAITLSFTFLLMGT
jgi:hypothetical protein